MRGHGREHDVISKFVAKMNKVQRLYVVIYICGEFVKKTNWDEPQDKQAAGQSMLRGVAGKANLTHRDHGLTAHHCPSHLYLHFASQDIQQLLLSHRQQHNATGFGLHYPAIKKN
jgi:hypothetical protein